MNALERTAAESALKLLRAGVRHKKWSANHRQQFTRALNALERLAGTRKPRAKKGPVKGPVKGLVKK